MYKLRSCIRHPTYTAQTSHSFAQRNLRLFKHTWRSQTHCHADMDYDVVVVGAGHAGCEAALASARLGCRTLLLTLTLDKIAWQPCNPAIGGPAKSQLVFEIDALGGEMGKMADRCYLQKRILNRSKGPAVWALRAQTDKIEYSQIMKQVLENQPNLDVREGMVVDISLDANDAVSDVKTFFGMTFHARSVVLTTGTFMNGVIWIGNQSLPAGRAGESPSLGLSERLLQFGFEMDRLKTGTPARVDSRTVDFAQLDPQPGDSDERWFSFDPRLHAPREQMCCYLTRTNRQTHQLIRDNLHLSPVYNGKLESKGPRYCPSIEDKIVRFSDKESHQIFLEPESRTNPELYVQGFSTGLPETMQLAMLQTLRGLEKVNPKPFTNWTRGQAYQCDASLQTKKFKGLFFSGQINGTTGYEEAAAQGLIAGINAARNAMDLELISLPRSSSYIGTLIDDLATKNLREPYRMLTSRSEYRLLLRSDNADQRLTTLGRDIGLIGDEQWKFYQQKQERIEREIQRLASIRLSPSDPICQEAVKLSEQRISNTLTLRELLKRPSVHYNVIHDFDFTSPDASLNQMDEETIEIAIKYEGFIRRQERQVAYTKARGERVIPQDIHYASISKLSLEAREHLQKIRPKTIGQASMIGGVSPADITALLIHLEFHKRSDVKSKMTT